MQNPDTDHDYIDVADFLAPEPGLDCPAIRTVCEILETLEDLRVLRGMQYEADLCQIDGHRHLFVNVWETDSEHNTHLAPDSDDWREGMIQPVVANTSRVIDGEHVPAYGWVKFDDDDQNDLHRLLGVLLIFRGCQFDDADLPF